MLNKSLAEKSFLSFVVTFPLLSLVSSDIVLAGLVSTLIAFSFFSAGRNQLPLGQVFIGLYLYLFVFRYFALIVFNESPQLGRAVIPISSMRDMLVLITQSSIFFFIILTVMKPKSNLNFQQEALKLWLLSKGSEYFSRALYFFVLLGFLMMLTSSGSLSSLANSLFYHQKINETKDPIWQLGLTLWSLFSVPALTLDLLKTLEPGRVGRNVFAKVRILLLVVILVFIFGGRLSILIASVTSVVIAKFINWRLKRNWYVLGLIFVAVFLFIGSARTGDSTNLFDSRQVLLSSTYPVLDAAALVADNPSEISNQLASKERYAAYLESMVPRFLWPNKPLLTNMTLDSQIANTFGWEGQRGVTGWPSGFVSEPYLIGGKLGVYAYMTVMALLFGLIQMRSARPHKSKLTGGPFIINFVIIYSLIATVKDGDTFASLQSGIRIFVWLHLALWLSKFFGKQVDTNLNTYGR